MKQLAFGAILTTLTLGWASPAQAGGIDPDKLIELIEKVVQKQSKGKRGRELSEVAKTGREKANAKHARRILDRTRISVHFDDTKFKDAIDFVRDVTNLNIVVSKKAQEEFADEELTLKLKKIKVRNCLELLLAQVSDDLKYGFRHGVLWIGRSDEVVRQLVVRVYYIGDIINPPKDFPAPRLGLKGLLGGDK